MSEFESTFAIGIDLGTTNCALAFASMGDDRPTPKPLAIPQVVAPGEVSPRRLLPSFLFLPHASQFADDALSVPWYPSAKDVVGTFAREQGSSTPLRLISSAKSWLSNTNVDRRAEILPWQAPDDVPRLSPLQASARYLSHLRAAWEQDHPDIPLAEQEVVLTVPASFDAVARELTVEAAELAGFDELRLLEEPQAALYDWVAQKGAAWREEVAVGDVILVVDIGGGTTDFSLINVCQVDGSMELERIAVGDHILLGGDNMDLALAYTVKAKLDQQGTKLDDWQMRALTHGCRAAKEALLGDDPPDAYPLVVPGRTSKLIGGSIRTELTRAELEQTFFAGFLPEVDADARPQQPRRAGLKTLGLPYANDAGITRHLASFLARASGDEASFIRPSAILFNGGVTRSNQVRERIAGILDRWLHAVGADPVRVLSGTDAELAVARGAAYYAHARHRGGIRIRGGTAQAYYVGIEHAELAVPGIEPRVDGVCIAPFGMEEGTEVELDASFGLVVGEDVSFQFFGSSTRREDTVGTLVDPGELIELAPIETSLEGEGSKVVEVRLHARVTEVGTLELSAVEQGGEGRRWKLSFDVRVQ